MSSVRSDASVLRPSVSLKKDDPRAGAALKAHEETRNVSSAAHPAIQGGSVETCLQLRIDRVLSFGRRLRSGIAHITLGGPATLAASASGTFYKYILSLGGDAEKVAVQHERLEVRAERAERGGNATSRASVRSIRETRRNTEKKPGRNVRYRKSTPAARDAVSSRIRDARALPGRGDVVD